MQWREDVSITGILMSIQAILSNPSLNNPVHPAAAALYKYIHFFRFINRDFQFPNSHIKGTIFVYFLHLLYRKNPEAYDQIVQECVQNSLKYDSVVSEGAPTTTAELEMRPVSLTNDQDLRPITDAILAERKTEEDLFSDTASSATESKIHLVVPCPPSTNKDQ